MNIAGMCFSFGIPALLIIYMTIKLIVSGDDVKPA